MTNPSTEQSELKTEAESKAFLVTATAGSTENTTDAHPVPLQAGRDFDAFLAALELGTCLVASVSGSSTKKGEA